MVMWRKLLGWFLWFFFVYMFSKNLTKLLIRLVRESGGLEETRNLAKKHAGQAVEALSRYPLSLWSEIFGEILNIYNFAFRYGESEYKNALVKLPETVLNRMK